MTDLALDFSSFQNISFDEAVGKLASGLAGETEPLMQFGKNLYAATVDAYAFRAGIARTGQQLTQGQRILARYVAMLDQMRHEQGDAARTMGSFARQATIAWGRFKAMFTSVGEIISPLSTGLARSLGSMARLASANRSSATSQTARFFTPLMAFPTFFSPPESWPVIFFSP